MVIYNTTYKEMVMTGGCLTLLFLSTHNFSGPCFPTKKILPLVRYNLTVYASWIFSPWLYPSFHREPIFFRPTSIIDSRCQSRFKRATHIFWSVKALFVGFSAMHIAIPPTNHHQRPNLFALQLAVYGFDSTYVENHRKWEYDRNPQ